MKQHLLELQPLGTQYQEHHDYDDAGDMCIVIPVFLGSTAEIMEGYGRAAAYAALSYAKNTDVAINGVPVFVAVETEHYDVVGDVLRSIPADNIVFFDRFHDYPQIDTCSGAALSMKLLPLLNHKGQRYDTVILSDAENFIVNPRGNPDANTLPICSILKGCWQHGTLGSHSYESSLEFTQTHLINQLNAIGETIESIATEIGFALDFSARVSKGFTLGLTVFNGVHRETAFRRCVDALVGIVNDEMLLEVYAKATRTPVIPLQQIVPVSVMGDLAMGGYKMCYHATGFELANTPEVLPWYEKQIALIRGD